MTPPAYCSYKTAEKQLYSLLVRACECVDITDLSFIYMCVYTLHLGRVCPVVN